MTRAAALVVATTLGATPVFADHPAPFRVEGMSALTTALITGGLTFLVALIVVVLIVVLTRPASDRSDSDTK